MFKSQEVPITIKDAKSLTLQHAKSIGIISIAIVTASGSVFLMTMPDYLLGVPRAGMWKDQLHERAEFNNIFLKFTCENLNKVWLTV